MGIPSYYKKLADHVKGLVCKSYEGKASSLYFDFNCMIYHCARRSNSTLPPYPGYDGNDEWESLLLEDIVKYIVKVWQTVGQPKEVFLAIDGVVPMAKIRQQRLRRFKSVWLSQKEKEEGLRENTPSWDTNCITPGTSFMKRLTTRLQTLCNKHSSWTLSGADEPGEGEHKIMKRLRAREASADPVLVYGLDADLILLTMLNAKSPAYLVREDSELGLVQYDSFGEEQFSYFSIEALKKTIPQEISLPNYVAGMSLLGNDFLPHSLTVKIRDDGHTKLIKTLQGLQSPLLIESNGLQMISHSSFLSIFEQWSAEEDDRMLHTFKKKLQMRGNSEKTLENKPLEWLVEEGLAWKHEGKWMIHPSWKNTYRKEWLQCVETSQINQICREYIFGLQWVIDYYTGQRPVDMRWCYSRLLPPLWSDLALYLQTQTYEEIPYKESSPIQPTEQLAMVLPLESWHFQTNAALRFLPSILPQFWPERFGFFSAGRIRLWECEALLPILSVDRIRSAVN